MSDTLKEHTFCETIYSVFFIRYNATNVKMLTSIPQCFPAERFAIPSKCQKTDNKNKGNKKTFNEL